MTSSPGFKSPEPSPSPPPDDSPSFTTFMRAARSEISDMHRRLDLVAQFICSDEPPDADFALELLRGVQGTVDSMVGSMAAMSEALRQMEAWQPPAVELV